MKFEMKIERCRRTNMQIELIGLRCAEKRPNNNHQARRERDEIKKIVIAAFYDIFFSKSIK